MVFTCIPESPAAVVNAALSGAAAGIVTVDDPSTLTRPLEIYGNDTHNAGKITVGKSVSDEAVVLTSSGTDFTFTPKEDNFLITYSQTAQVMGLAAEIPVPVDAVFVLDTSGSMNESDRAQNMVTAANKAIKTLLDANENSRVAVVAFSSADSGDDEYGGGTSNGAAASVLSSLKHYDTTSDHLTWVNSSGSASGNNRNYIAGRDSVTVTIGSPYRRRPEQYGWRIRVFLLWRYVALPIRSRSESY